MNPDDFAKITKALENLADKQEKMYDALMGKIGDSKPGALHTLQKVCEDLYRPDNPRRSMDERIIRLEDEKTKRVGFMAACCIVGGVVSNYVISWLTNKK